MFVYEVIPSYIFPLLNGFNIFCLASQHAPQRTRDVFTNLFGGSDGNEGLGFLSLSFDWQYIGSTFMSLPLIQQGVMFFLHLLLSSSSTRVVSEFVDWIRLMLHHTHGHLLLECLGGSSIYLAPLHISTTQVHLGSILPHAVVLHLLFKRLEIPTDGCVRHNIHAQRNCA